MSNTHNSLAFLLAKSILDNPHYQLPYRSTEVERNAKHVVELITHLANELDNQRFEVDTSLLKGKL